MSRLENFLQNIQGLFISPKKEVVQKQASKTVPFSVQAANELPEYAPMNQTAYLHSYTSWVYAAVRKRAQNVAKIDLRLFKKLSSKGEESFKEINQHPVLDLLDRVNEMQTFTNLIEYTQTIKDLAGECFWWIVKNEQGLPLKIYPFLRPDHLQIATSEEKMIAGYIYTVPGSTQQITFEPDEIIHHKYIDPIDPYRGYSPIKAAEIEVATNEESAKWNWRFFKNNAKPFGVITVNSTLQQDQMERIKAQWEQKHRGEENAFRLAVLGNGAKYEDHGFNQKDMDFKELRMMSRDEILAAYQVPLAVINPNESINRSTADTAKNLFIDQTILPLMQDIVLTLNEFLLPMYKDDNLIFDYMNESSEDIENKLKSYENGIRNGWLTPNEIRKEEDLEDYPEGNNFYIPTSYVSVGKQTQKKKYHIPNVKYKHRSDSEITEDFIKDSIKEKLGSLKLFKSKQENVKKKIKTNNEHDQIGELLWKRKQNILKQEKSLFLFVLRKEFDRQKRKVLRSIKSQKAFSEIDFDLEIEITKLTNALSEPIKIILKENYADALRLHGLDLLISEATLEEYVNDYGLKYITTINKTTQKHLQNIYEIGLKEGKSIGIIKNEIAVFFEKTIIERSKQITNTELQRMVNWASEQAYKDSKVISGKQWYTALDERVCPYCAPLHDKIISLDDNFFDLGQNFLGDAKQPLKIDYTPISAPPLHVTCRCTIIPITIPIEEQT